MLSQKIQKSVYGRCIRFIYFRGVPTKFREKLLQKEDMKIMMLGKRLSWKEVMRYAIKAEKEDWADNDRRTTEADTEALGTKVPKLKWGLEESLEKLNQKATKTTKLQTTQCSWRHKAGHMIASCRHRLGTCFACGSREHLLKNCRSHKKIPNIDLKLQHSNDKMSDSKCHIQHHRVRNELEHIGAGSINKSFKVSVVSAAAVEDSCLGCSDTRKSAAGIAHDNSLKWM